VLQPPRDRAICGTRWAQPAAQFSLLANGSQIPVQQIVDCTWGHSNYACQGGNAGDAYWWFINESIPSTPKYRVLGNPAVRRQLSEPGGLSARAAGGVDFGEFGFVRELAA
jgi:hypothetical protein